MTKETIISDFLKPVNVCKELGLSFKVFRSIKLSKNSLLANRYYLEFNQQERIIATQNLNWISKQLMIPNSAILTDKSISKNELTFIGVEAGESHIDYRLYFNFHLENRHLRKAYAIHWKKGDRQSVYKLYQEGFVESFDELINSLPNKLIANHDIIRPIREIVQERGFSSKVFVVTNAEQKRKSFDLSLPAFKYANVHDQFREIASCFGVKDQYEACIAPADYTKSIARFAFGEKDKEAFVTLYLEGDALPQWIEPVHKPVDQKPVFVLGKLNYRFKNEQSKEAIAVEFGRACITDTETLMDVMDDRPDCRNNLYWTIETEGKVLYAIDFNCAYEEVLSDELRSTFRAQLHQSITRFCLAGTLTGEQVYIEGALVELIVPDTRCIYAWNEASLLQQMIPENSIYSPQKVLDVLNQIRYSEQNYGVTPRDRAVNYLMVNLGPITGILRKAGTINMRFQSMTTHMLADHLIQINFIFKDYQNNNRSPVQYSLRLDISETLPMLTGQIFSKSVEHIDTYVKP